MSNLSPEKERKPKRKNKILMRGKTEKNKKYDLKQNQWMK
jgi:hypothetical protein